MYVVSLDPGRTTGYTITDVVANTAYIFTGEAEVNELQLMNMLHSVKADHIVYEGFEYQRRVNAELYSRDLIGVIKLYAQTHTACELWYQKPAQGFDYWTNKRLKEYGVYTVGCEHARDATRHLMYWFMFGGGFQFGIKEFVQVDALKLGDR